MDRYFMKYKFLKLFFLVVFIVVSFLSINNLVNAQTSSCSQAGTGPITWSADYSYSYQECVTGTRNCFSGDQCVPDSGAEVWSVNTTISEGSEVPSLGNSIYCGKKATCVPPVPTLSCAVDTSATPAPHYTGTGVKFLATGGTGTYSWTATGGTPSSGTGNQIWPAWSTTGTKTVSVTSGAQNASCTVSITSASTPHNVTAIADSGVSITSTNPVVGIMDGNRASFTLNASSGYSISPDVTGDCPVNLSDSPSDGSYSTGIFSNADLVNCTVGFSSTQIPLSCAVDTSTTPAPHYTGTGVKFLASNGVGTYSWSAPGATPSSGTGNQIWPIYSTAGTKTVSVSTPTQSAVNCSVSITAAPTPVNGACATTHYNCTSPVTSTNNVDGVSFWTWVCPGLNGGSSASCTEVKPVMSGALNASNCTISAGSSSCNTNLSWTTTNPESTSRVTTPTDITVATTLSGSTTYSVAYGDRSFYLYNNAKLLAQATATASCVSGAPWDTVSGTCKTSIDPVNGSCAATHNNCIAGTSVDTIDTPAFFNWSCNGLNGGTSATCTEAKLPDLIASAPTPATDVVVNTIQRYTSTVTNQGTASTGASFNSFWQVATDWAGAGTVYDLLPTSSSSSLSASGITTITYDMSFNGLGRKSMRACADKSSAASTGTITESDETNNCSPWTNITVTAVAAMSGTLTASNCTLVSGRCDTNLVWTTTNPEATSAVTTPTNITVGTGLNGSATYTMSSAGARTFYLYNNGKLLAQATATAYDSAPPSCTDTGDFIGSVTPASVSTGGAYTVSCDFGVVSGYIGASVGSGSCSWGGWSEKPETQANFNCNAGGIPGSFSNSCIISYNETYPYCSRTEAVNPLTVTSLPGGIINGVCSNPDNHLNRCLTGTPSAVVNGISSWTWSCIGSGVGHTDASCEELKKKPKFEED